MILGQDPGLDTQAEAERFIDPEKDLPGVEAVLAGARDIIAEKVSEDQESRKAMRKLYQTRSTIRSRVIQGKEQEGAKYQDYFDWEERLDKVPSHRLLAMRR